MKRHARPVPLTAAGPFGQAADMRPPHYVTCDRPPQNEEEFSSFAIVRFTIDAKEEALEREARTATPVADVVLQRPQGEELAHLHWHKAEERLRPIQE